MQYYLAVDIGASSGRHILAHMENGKMILEEIHRFPNGMTNKDGRKVWDVDRLFGEIKTGMMKCAELGKIPVSIGIDTWAVDYVFLNEAGMRISDAVGYRDSRTEGMDDKVYEIIPQKELYARTGIQKQIFNTIYQLMAEKTYAPELLAEADTMLLVPDYFHYLLTGVKKAEYTNASTTQLLNPETKEWDFELIDKLGYPKKIFPEIVMAGTCIGGLTPEIQEEIGYNCKVVVPPTHDTASAVAAVPAAEGEDTLYISSGTWSLMGTELPAADCSEAAGDNNFTNEGGYEYRFRFLKNIMGLWMIQSVKKEIGQNLSFGEICDMASKVNITSRVDANAARFLAPANMTEEVRSACSESGQQVPEGIAEVASVIYNSLADCYRDAGKEIESLTGKTYDKIRIVGGGANAEYLNELTAKASGKAVCAGPVEGTAIGNLSVQMITGGEFKDLWEARNCISKSFPIYIYQPE